MFGARGYEGATTDEVARAAGVSQPYVVRLFGTKENLFLATIEYVARRAARACSARRWPTTASDPVAKRIGEAYVDLLEHRAACTRRCRTRS